MTALARLQSQYDVAVIGAGPAGMAAGAETAAAGLATLVLDENGAPGGQIYRAVTVTPVRAPDVLGAAYWRGAELVAELAASGAELVTGAVAWSLSRDLEIAVSLAGASRLIRARRVILATGALERPFAIPGWTLPGVMTVGGAQSLLKASGLIPQGRVVLAGTGPLLWLYARQLLRAGGDVACILDTAPATNYLRALPHLPAFLASPYLGEGLALVREVARRVRVRRIVALAARGGDRLGEVVFHTARGEGRMPCEHLLLHQGLAPNVNLALSAGVPHRWDRGQLCWLPAADRLGDTPLPGIAIAGDGARIGGARVAEARGRVAGHAAIAALKGGGRRAAHRAGARSDRIGRAFLDALFRPSRRLRLPAEDGVVVCRCEEVTAGEVRAAVRQGCAGPNQLKAFLRCGMGPCQGRLCGLTITELIADQQRVAPQQVGYFRLRPPVKPVALAELAALPRAEAPAPGGP